MICYQYHHLDIQEIVTFQTGILFIDSLSRNMIFHSYQCNSFFLQRKLPQEGWDDLAIEHFLQELALMDSNNFSGDNTFFLKFSTSMMNAL